MQLAYVSPDSLIDLKFGNAQYLIKQKISQYALYIVSFLQHYQHNFPQKLQLSKAIYDVKLIQKINELQENAVTHQISELGFLFQIIDFLIKRTSDPAIKVLLSQFSQLKRGIIHDRKQILNKFEAKQTLVVDVPFSQFGQFSRLIGVPSDNVASIVLRIDINIVQKGGAVEYSYHPLPLQIEQNSRLLRQFGASNFVRVTFSSNTESFGRQKVCYALGATRLTSVVKELLLSGFFFNNRYWVYLGQSSSQIKEQQCWFVAAPYISQNVEKTFVFYNEKQLFDFNHHNYMSDNQLNQLKLLSLAYADHIRRWLGNFSHINLICKISSRMGICFGKSSPSISFAKSINILFFPDIVCKDSSATYTFTDGCGEISFDIMQQVSEQQNNLLKQIQICDHEYQDEFMDDQQDNKSKMVITPSAIQFRYAGIKGVLVMNPNLPANTVIFNDSQVKYQIDNPTSTQQQLEVLSLAESTPGYLNQQIVVLLSAGGVKNEVFQELTQDTLKYIINLSPQNIKQVLNKMRYRKQGNLAQNMLLCGVDLNDIVLSDNISLMQDELLNNLLETYRIRVPCSRFMMGVYDVLNVLSSTEVHIGIQNPIPSQFISGFPEVLYNREVIVAKNPCTHPGDVQKYTAVDAVQTYVARHDIQDKDIIFKLYHMYRGVIVFPVCQTEERNQLYRNSFESYPSQSQINMMFRPLPDCLGGADLDGDRFFVCWDERVVHQFCPSPPAIQKLKSDEISQIIYKVTDIENSALKQNDSDIQKLLKSFQLTIEQFNSILLQHCQNQQLISYAAGAYFNNLLGLIGNALLISGDILGYNHILTMELSRCFNLCVDSDKNGWTATPKTKLLLKTFYCFDISQVNQQILSSPLLRHALTYLNKNKEIKTRRTIQLIPIWFAAKNNRQNMLRRSIIYTNESCINSLYILLTKQKGMLTGNLTSYIMNFDNAFLPDKRLFSKYLKPHFKQYNFQEISLKSFIEIDDRYIIEQFPICMSLFQNIKEDCMAYGLNLVKKQQYTMSFKSVNHFEIQVIRALCLYYISYSFCRKQFLQLFNQSVATVPTKVDERTDTQQQQQTQLSKIIENQQFDIKQMINIFEKDVVFQENSQVLQVVDVDDISNVSKRIISNGFSIIPPDQHRNCQSSQFVPFKLSGSSSLSTIVSKQTPYQKQFNQKPVFDFSPTHPFIGISQYNDQEYEFTNTVKDMEIQRIQRNSRAKLEELIANFDDEFSEPSNGVSVSSISSLSAIDSEAANEDEPSDRGFALDEFSKVFDESEEADASSSDEKEKNVKLMSISDNALRFESRHMSFAVNLVAKPRQIISTNVKAIRRLTTLCREVWDICLQELTWLFSKLDGDPVHVSQKVSKELYFK